MKRITKTEVKTLIKNLNYSKDAYSGFAIVNDKIELVHSDKRHEVAYRIDGYIKRWKNNDDTLQEAIMRVYDYMNDVIEYYNQGIIK